MWITCTQKKVNIKSNTVKLNPEHYDAHLHAEEGEDRVKLPQKGMWITCKQKKVIIKSNTVQNTMVITCLQKKVEIKSNTIQNTMVIACM